MQLSTILKSKTDHVLPKHRAISKTNTVDTKIRKKATISIGSEAKVESTIQLDPELTTPLRASMATIHSSIRCLLGHKVSFSKSSTKLAKNNLCIVVYKLNVFKIVEKVTKPGWSAK